MLAALAFVRQRELYLPVEAVLPGPFNLYSYILACPEDNSQDSPQDVLEFTKIFEKYPEDCPEDSRIRNTRSYPEDSPEDSGWVVERLIDFQSAS